MKSKFAGFVRGLFRQLDDNEPARSVAPPPPTAPAPSTPRQAYAAAIDKGASLPKTDGSNAIEILLAPIIASLPLDLKAKLMAQPPVGQTIILPVETVVSQLAFGAIKISFGELRRLAPGIFANSGGEHDSRQVALPLQEILSRINPALLSRRPAQKVEVAEEVAGPFAGRGRGVTFTSQPLKAPIATPPPAAGLSLPAESLPPAAPPAAPRLVTPQPETFSFTPRQTAPATPPIAFTPPAKPPVHEPSNGNGNANPALPAFKFSAAPVSPAPAASSAPAPEPAQPSSSAPALHVSLNDLAEKWPEPLKQEIAQSNPANFSVSLPLSLIEPGLKRGRVTMTWKELRTLAKPGSAPSPNDALVLDLPLKILAPAFLAVQKKLGRGQTKIAVSSEIPNLFFGFPQSAPATAPAPTQAPVAAPAPAPTAPIAMAPVAIPPAVVASKPSDTNYFGLAEPVEPVESLRMASPATDFLSRQMHPKDVVAQAVALPGVAGAIVTLADGLRVASEIPAELNPETVAAFLPQIYERVNQSTRELRMGALNNLSFTVGNVPWKIFRVNSIYFAAFGRAGEPLPKPQLAALAAELDRKK